MNITDAIVLLLYWRQHPESAAWNIAAEREARSVIECRATELMGMQGKELLDAVIKSDAGDA